MNSVDDVGRWAVGFVVYTREILLMTYLSFRATLFHQKQSLQTILSVVFSQVYFTGYQALPLISALALGTSSVVVMQSSSQFNLLGSSNLVGQLIVVLIVREIAPLMTALIVIARSGTAVTSEIGNMRVNREIEALEAMGINPLSFIVFPRLIGGMLSVVCLALYFIYVAIAGGFLFSKIFLNMPLDFYIDSIMHVFTYEDVILFACKIIFSGAIIFTVCCYQGLQVRQGSHEVPQVTTVGVVKSIIYVVSFNLFVTILFYLNQLMRVGLI
jgi:phospholipid/cholesterol/gamma-HCH transport system permease protein